MHALQTWNFKLSKHKMRFRQRQTFVSFFLQQIGEVGILLGQTIKRTFSKPWEWKNFINQLEEIGVRSLPVVSLTAAFGGLVFGLQTYVGFHRYIGPGSEAYGGPIISLGLSKELIPILVGLSVSERIRSVILSCLGLWPVSSCCPV